MSIYLHTNSDGEKSQGYINSGKNEGIGAISQYQILLYAVCKKFKVEFYNSGFKNIGHSTYSEYSQEEWDNSFTNFFNLSTNKIIENQISFTKIDEELISFIETHINDSKDFLIYLDPEEVLRYSQSIIDEIYQKKYLIDLKNNFNFNQQYFSNQELNISLHIRCINPEDVMFQDIRELYTSKEKFRYINLINYLKKVCTNEKVNLHIYSQGEDKNFLNILNCEEDNFKVTLHLNQNPISDIYHMCYSDLFIMSNSSFSWIVHLLNYNPTLVRNNFWHSTYPNTLKLDEKYLFNINKLRIV
tara:strand:+ start:3684 stop:4586 length:903 start_codon:yes stop_codon:yes gene_type:complete